MAFRITRDKYCNTISNSDLIITSSLTIDNKMKSTNIINSNLISTSSLNVSGSINIGGTANVKILNASAIIGTTDINLINASATLTPQQLLTGVVRINYTLGSSIVIILPNAIDIINNYGLITGNYFQCLFDGSLPEGIIPGNTFGIKPGTGISIGTLSGNSIVFPGGSSVIFYFYVVSPTVIEARLIKY